MSWFPHVRDREWVCPPPDRAATAYHHAMAGYAATRLVDLPSVARDLDVGRVLVKEESARFGLPAFKALGASWAVHRALGDAADRTRPVVTATDGNHGRAVARFARLTGHPASVFVPAGIPDRSVAAIRGEGASVTVVDGSYDDAVAVAAATAADTGAVLVQDTAWEGYEEVPGWIVEGYDTLFAECDEQLADVGPPDLVLVPTGVGSLLQAALAHYRCGGQAPAVLSVEPDAAACVAPSLAAGRRVTVETGSTIMAGLNCGTLSTLAWPYIAHGLDGAVTVSDAETEQALRDLAGAGVDAGPSGASSLAGLRATLAGGDQDERRRHLRLDPRSVVLLLVTEGGPQP